MSFEWIEGRAFCVFVCVFCFILYSLCSFAAYYSALQLSSLLETLQFYKWTIGVLCWHFHISFHLFLIMLDAIGAHFVYYLQLK